jgi:hypothetical protein
MKPGPKVLEVEHLSVTLDGMQILRNISFSLRRRSLGDREAKWSGQNGALSRFARRICLYGRDSLAEWRRDTFRNGFSWISIFLSPLRNSFFSKRHGSGFSANTVAIACASVTNSSES